MGKKSFTLAILYLILASAFCQHQTISDGPYIFIKNQQLIQKHIEKGEVFTKQLEAEAYDTTFKVTPAFFQGVEKIAALSDIHGQYDLTIEILQNNQIIDNELNWNFGEGHLVIVGDIFDRGGNVTEVLWLIYKLEKQAMEAGGKVHYLLGNHEYMVLHKDLRYLHEKYPIVSELLNISYDDLYGANTVLGKWLRSKHTILKINDYLFVHGGISQDFVTNSGVNIEAINEIMRASIDRSKEEMKATDFYSTYYGSTGPIWYRGYFYDPISEIAIDSILKQVNSARIIVGHCSYDEVVSRYNNKVFGVDSSIKKGEYGEVLFLIGEENYRGTKSGKRIRFY
ncbi:Calcineurin-like phosphoesterase [Ekhidna lutea]|uniref:Calcineurin-like phosphoesterase n=1 Tax=Ekhidna lutea TaxID=447679 RepID=A0A239JYP5_EKHLU|nr:metallophosphoesterase [Ekhidna lutea]SNT11127.1 Calcineurin-like phosphoesterase [Ekhidna lutea]